ncbi:inositol-pentakisphosphate 2-kinase-like [Mercenaria mercenaria]|uniref:inositol-pentakisphosphate 2-kinase-like n=1 Tax=Mercenaria mercenaria TaxID=6596 RepID=UPI00234F2187|nr:inositol-pentakisphosphate 2-kinase-like [Mercenaria mercenaria]
MADASKWKFRGEGNACLVLVNLEEKMVFRLAKSKYWGKGQLATNAENKVDMIHEEMQLVVDYMKNVMQPLLSPYFVVLPELRLLNGRLTEEAEYQIKASRPGKIAIIMQLQSCDYCNKVVMHCTWEKNFLKFNKLVHTPTLSVEIKPKKAFMHVQDSLNVKSEEKSQVCKFCMHQRLKAKEGQWPVTSRYCPLDLFSGNRVRMKQALLSLAETPQNNLRICQDGEEIHGAWNKGDMCEVLEGFFGSSHNGVSNGVHKGHKLMQIFMDLVLEALLYVPGDIDDSLFEMSNSNPLTVQYCQNSRYRPDLHSDCDNCGDLPTGCVLERILSTQMLDSLDIDGIFPLYLKLKKCISEAPALRRRLCMDGPYCGDDWLQACSQLSCDVDDDLFIEDLDCISSMVNKVKRFLISKTVQDCSVMVALQRVPDSYNEDEGGQLLKDVEGRLFRFSVSLVDLDPKPFCKIPNYHKQDNEIINAYREACGGEFSGTVDET